jgi:hypothetical protein
MTEESTQEIVVEPVGYDVNEVQAALTASKVLVAILETLGEVRVLTKTVFEATNKDKELIVDYDENGPAFIFRLPKSGELDNGTEAVIEPGNE